MDLYEYQRSKVLQKDSPLAARLRPTKLEDFVGQEHVVGKSSLLYRAIKADKITSIILYGPPGTGKTTLAKIIANTTKSNFIQLNATTSGVKDIKMTVEDAKLSFSTSTKRTILFVDEIHRFNKSQQDTLLPHVEDGTIILIGATTENPYFEVNKALISRSIIFKLIPLTSQNIKELLLRAMSDTEKGLGNYNAILEEEALRFLSDISNGDARVALNAIELAVLSTDRSDDGKIHITLQVAEGSIQKRAINYDKNGDNHYDVISAFIKSMRGSDPDAALYYMARMLYAGEDPKFIARRIVICASEDVGNADPHALLVAVAAFQATELIGMPECRINLAQAVTYISSAPKSNACYLAIDLAMEDVSNLQIKEIPIYLRDSSYKGAKEFGHGLGYSYPHNFTGNYVRQNYLPDELIDKIYYNPSDNGVEKKIKDSLRKIKGNVYD
jgi:putative ATPase